MGIKSNKKIDCPPIGILAVKKGFISKKQLSKALNQIGSAQNKISALSDYFLSQQWISQKQLDLLFKTVKMVSLKKSELQFGTIAIRKNFITKEDFGKVLNLQKKFLVKKQKRVLIGDLLIAEGMMTVAEKNKTLKIQKQLMNIHRSVSKEVTGESITEPNVPEAESTEIPTTERPKQKAEMILPGVQLRISEDYMQAYLSKTDDFDDNLTVPEIKVALSEKDIISGLAVDEMIQVFLKSRGFKTKAFRVAKGTLPVKGRDAELSFFFDTDHLKVGGISDDGSIDFKKRGELPLVEAGTLLVEKTPMIQSKNGENIFGELLETTPRKDTSLRIGKGTHKSEDGLKLLAKVTGYPKFALDGVVSVTETYTIQGDVDYETGHVKYKGNVEVKGQIKPGFRVSGNDISAFELEGGDVIADGDVTIRGGINEGTIYARGNVTAHFIHNSQIICMGNVIVTKEIVDSTIESVGACMIPDGKIIASNLTTKMGCSTRHLGTQTTRPCKIHIGHDAFTEREIQKIEKKIEDFTSKRTLLKDEMTAHKEEYATLQKRINELAHIQDRSQLKKQELEKEKKELNGKTNSKEIDAEIEALENTALNAEEEIDLCFEKSKALENETTGKEILLVQSQIEHYKTEKKNLLEWAGKVSGIPLVMVKGAVQSDTIIKGRNSELTIRETTQYVRFTEVLQKGEGEPQGQRHEIQVSPYSS